MKKLFFSLMLASTLGAQAQGVVSKPTTDYVYATELAYDNAKSLYYFDVVLNGSMLYTSYGMDIKLPQGIAVDAITQRGGAVKANVVILNGYGSMYEDDLGSTEHSLSPAFTTDDTDHTHIRVGAISTSNYDMCMESGKLFRVYVKSSCTANQWPVGGIKFFDVELNANDGSVDGGVQPYNTATRITPVAMYEGTSTLAVAASATAPYYTCVLPFASELPTGVKAYEFSAADATTATFSPVEAIAAYTPCILVPEAGANVSFSGEVDVENIPANGIAGEDAFKGAVVAQSVESGENNIYVLQTQNEVTALFTLNGSIEIPAGKCWLEGQTASAPLRIVLLDEDATAINGVNAEISNNGKFVENGCVVIVKNGKKFTAAGQLVK